MSEIPIQSASGQQAVDEPRPLTAKPRLVGSPSPETGSQAKVALGVASLEHLWFDDANALPDLLDSEFDGVGTASAGASSDPVADASVADDSDEDDEELAPIAFAPVAGSDAETGPNVSAAEPSEPGEMDRPLVWLCEPLFNDICRLNRIKRLGGEAEMVEPEKIRLRLEKRLERLSTTARRHDLAALFATVAGPLRSFVDVVLTRGGFSFAENWRPLSPRWAEPDRVLLAAAADALCNGDAVETGQLEVLQSCLSLTADLLRPGDGQPPGEDLLGAMGRRLIRPSAEHICPSAYGGLFTQALLPPIGRQLKVLVAVSLSALLLTIAIAVMMNLRSARELDSSIDVVRQCAGAGGSRACSTGALILTVLKMRRPRLSIDRLTDYHLCLAFALALGVVGVLWLALLGRWADSATALRSIGWLLLAGAAALAMWAVADRRAERRRRAALDRVVDEEMSGKWTNGFARIVGAYEKPWYLLCGETGVGKTAALRGAELPTVMDPSGLPVTDPSQGINGTYMFDWWFFRDAVLLDSAGDLIENPDLRWTAFLERMRNAHPLQPINGMLLAVSAPDLLSDTATLRRKAMLLARQVEVAQDSVARAVPALPADYQGRSDRRVRGFLRGWRGV